MTWLLPPRFDRHRRRQLAFELAGASLLAVATGAWALVCLAASAAVGIARMAQHRSPAAASA